MKNKKTIPRIKVVLGIIMSFIVVGTLSPVVFLANTPQINPHFAADLRLLPVRAMASLRHPFNKEEIQNEVENERIAQNSQPPTEEVTYTPLTTGVQAAEEPSTGRTIVEIEPGTELYKYTVRLTNGEVVTIYTPVKR